MSMQDFIQKVKQDEALKQEVNAAGTSLAQADSDKLKRDLANKLSEIAARHGYEVHPDEFFGQDDPSWMQG